MLTKKFNTFLNKSLFVIVKGYQYLIGPLLNPQCRYYPTCSHYALEALDKKTTYEALRLIVRRVCSCHPFGGHGYDPLP